MSHTAESLRLSGPRGRCRLVTLLALGLLLVGGCGSEQERTAPAEESWYTLSMGGSRAGFVHTRVQPKQENGSKLLSIRQELHHDILRFGQPYEMKMVIDSLETADGQLVSFEIKGAHGSQGVEIIGEVAGGKLTYRNKNAAAVAWDSSVGGFLALEQSLERQPMQPGERRAVRKPEPDPLQSRLLVMDHQLTAADYEMVKVRDSDVELLRIEDVQSIEGQGAIPQTLWTDRQGRIVKWHMPSLRLELVKCSKTEAQKKIDGPRFDIGAATAVPIERRTAGLAKSRRVRYGVRLREQDPSAVFANGPSQRVLAKDARTAEIVVRALRPDTPGVSDDSRPTEADVSPGPLIQSDHAAVLALAAQAAPDEKDRWKLALALEQHVKKSMRRVDFSSALATAAEVAESLEGDCTEHAMLLAALARARGIPARVALGLVVVENGAALGFHMWTEVHLADRWLALDATRAQGGISAGYLKLTDTNLAGQTGGLDSLLQVIKVLGQFEKLEVLEAE